MTKDTLKVLTLGCLAFSAFKNSTEWYYRRVVLLQPRRVTKVFMILPTGGNVKALGSLD